MNGEDGFRRSFPEIIRAERAEQLQHRFTYHPLQPGQAEIYERVRAGGLDFARLLNAYVPDGPELARAIDAIDQAVMLANAAVARHWGS